MPALHGTVRRRLRARAVAFIGAIAVLLGALAWSATSASATNAGTPGNPQFKVTCYGIKTAPDDPIVFPGMPGKSHMHSFFGAKNISADSTPTSLLSQPASQCGSNYTMDRSAYWVPTLYKNGQPVFTTDGSTQLRAYYDSSDGHPVDQPFPQGLKMIAGDMMATNAIWPATQDGYPVDWYKCVKTNDTGSQRSASGDDLAKFPTCNSDESMVLVITFPDCWDGMHLDSADHKSHMAYAAGPNAQGRTVCDSAHPVKLPRLTEEVWYYGVNGAASDFSYATMKNAAGQPVGSSYSLHADVMSAWDPTAFAGLTYACIDKAKDCSGLEYGQVDRSGTPQSMIDVQTKVLPGSGGSSSSSTTSSMPMTTKSTTPSSSTSSSTSTKSTSAQSTTSTSTSKSTTSAPTNTTSSAPPTRTTTTAATTTSTPTTSSAPTTSTSIPTTSSSIPTSSSTPPTSTSSSTPPPPHHHRRPWPPPWWNLWRIFWSWIQTR